MTTFLEAVHLLHDVDAPLYARSAANAWLVSFAEDPAAPQQCVALLSSAASGAHVPETALVFAAGVVATAAMAAGLSSASPLLELCRSLPSRAAVTRLAGAAAAVAATGQVEGDLLRAPAFQLLEMTRQLVVLDALAQHLEGLASAEELACRPSFGNACRLAVALIESALLTSMDPPTEPHATQDGPAATAAPVDATLRCLGSWAACGFSFGQLVDEHAALLGMLLVLVRRGLFPDVPDEASDSQGASVGAAEAREARATLQASLAACAIRDCLQCSMDLGEEIEIAGCAHLLHLVAALGGRAAQLGAPRVDALGSSDGGGAISDELSQLAGAIGAIAGLLLELLLEPLIETVQGAAVASQSPDGESASHLFGLLNVLLACTSHTLSGPAEVAAAGWISLASALPPRASGGSKWEQGGALATWRQQVFTRLLEVMISRCSRSHLRRGTGEDLEDLESFRQRCAAPLFVVCSEQLGGARWLHLLAAGLRPTGDCGHMNAGGCDCFPPAVSGLDPEMVEVLLFAASSTSPRCLAAEAEAGAEGRLSEAFYHLAARFARWAGTLGPQWPGVLQHAKACQSAIAGAQQIEQ